MKNPEDSGFRLNFSQLFQKSRVTESYIKNNSFTNRSERLYPSSNLSQRASNFIPKYPYGRSISVNSQRKNHQKGYQEQDLRIFSIRTLEGKSPRYMNKSVDEKRSKKSEIRFKILNGNINFLKINNQFAKKSDALFQTKMKIKGLKIRTGSEVKKINKKYNSIIM